MNPKVIVCTGGGGVGKTTTSAALALALAKRGDRTLIVSLDPARRLADALGVELGTDAREVALDTGDGKLFALMPDPKDALRTFAELLAEEEPAALERLRGNVVYQAMEGAVPGIHELASISLTWRAIERHDVDTVVIDTAPSRNAVDFITYPKRLAQLLGSRAIGWMADIGARAGSARRRKPSRVERLMVWAIGPVVSDVAEFFTELALVRERFVWLNEHVAKLLTGANTHYFLVASPTAAARADAHYLLKKLRGMKLRPHRLILNSAFILEREWLAVLEDADIESEAIREVLARLNDEDRSREQASEETSKTFAERHPNLVQLRLPHLEVPEPRDVVVGLSRHLAVSQVLAT